MSKEKVVHIELPQSSVGAPLPKILSDESSLYVAYYLESSQNFTNGTSIKEVTEESTDETVGIISFELFLAYQFGAPNDEAIDGHPLSSKGLRPYGSFIIENSKWLKYFEKINRVHPEHKKEDFEFLNHYILTFHDTTLEIIAKDYSVEIFNGSMQQAIQYINQTLFMGT
jgi:hypothetical protein